MCLLSKWSKDTTVKTCFKCSLTKPLGEFYKHPNMADGHLNKCKDCAKLDTRKDRYGDKREKVLERDRKRATLPHRKEASKRKAKTEKGKESKKVAMRKYVETFPDRHRTHKKFSNALRAGKVVRQPCFICGEVMVEGHHPDYNSPLEVVWLCQKHHKEVHKMVGRLSF